MNIQMNDRPRILLEDKVSGEIARALKRHGVELTFGQSLPSALQLASSDVAIQQVAYRTENAGVCMADGYARISGKIPVVTAQNGPAATLLVPGLAEARKASVPIVALVQEVPARFREKNAFQEFDHFELFRSCAKWIARIDDPSRAADYVDRAFAIAGTGRMGPVVLLLPYDVLSAPSAATVRTACYGRFPLDRPCADSAAVQEAASLLSTARAPLVVAGGGVHLSGAHEALARLQNSFHLPIATTNMGKGSVDESHPLSLGVIGNTMGVRGATRYMRPMIDGADVVFFIGNRTNQNGTDSWTLFPPGARYIHLDIDGEEIGRNYEALRLVGDARTTLAALHDAIAGIGPDRSAAGAAAAAGIAEARRRHQAEAADVVASPHSPVRPERLMAEMQRVLSPETIVVADASYSSNWVTNYLTALKPGMRFLTPRGLAGLGWGFPMAMGAKLARPSSPVLCLVGDGGFGHCWQELETARRMGISVVVTVLNNGVLGYQKDAETADFGRYTDACHFVPVDHAQIARACGCDGVRITDPAVYGEALLKAIASDRTTVLDVITDPAAYPPVTVFDGRLN